VPTVNCEGVTVNYHEIGNGSPVVLIHCSSSSHRQWRSLWELLQNKHRVIAVDLLGWGGTDGWTKQRNTLLEDEAALVLEVIKGLDEDIQLVGHSYGGTIAYHLAMTAPEKFKSLTLIEPMLGWILDPEIDSALYDEIRGVAENFWQKHSAGKSRECIEHYFDYWNGPGSWQTVDEGFAEYVLAGAEKNFHEFKAIFNGGAGLAPPESFKNPTLLIGGAQSNKPPLRVMEILEKRFPDARRHLIEGATHMSPISHSEQVNPMIRDFVAG
jgi:pimeloyl-ACP methyl ester carboxylesterase